MHAAQIFGIFGFFIIPFGQRRGSPKKKPKTDNNARKKLYRGSLG
jgi:hypothetical protein